jgi:hypothetical protein
MKRCLPLLLCLFSPLLASAGELIPDVEHPLPRRLDRESYTVDLSGAYLRKIVSPNAGHQYRMAPVLLTLRMPGIMEKPLGSGTFCIRTSATLIAESIFRGPETNYFGIAFRPSIEWWNAGESFHLYFSPGGGVGTIDSRGIEGGQGQDFTLNILIGAGAGWKVSERVSLKAGVLFQHLSNGGQTDPNPGLNAIGPELGLSVSF